MENQNMKKPIDINMEKHKGFRIFLEVLQRVLKNNIDKKTEEKILNEIIENYQEALADDLRNDEFIEKIKWTKKKN